jgi:hypothetical protein
MTQLFAPISSSNKDALLSDVTHQRSSSAIGLRLPLSRALGRRTRLSIYTPKPVSSLAGTIRPKSSKSKISSTSSHLQVAGVVLVTLFEVLLCLVYLEAWLSAGLGLLLHFGLVGTLTVVFAKRYLKLPIQTYDFPLFLICTSFLGPVGCLGVGLAILFRRASGSEALDADDRFSALFPETSASQAELLCEQIQRGESARHMQDTLASFSDVLAGGPIESRQAVIALIMNHFSPAFAPALHTALHDPEAEVRAQAATAVARIESGFLGQAILLKERCSLEKVSDSALYDLALHLDNYANSGLLDVERAKAARLESLVLYQQSEALRDGGLAGDQDFGSNSVVRLLVRLGRDSDAVQACEKIIQSGLASPQLVSWYAEALFKLKRFDDLHQLCVKYPIHSNWTSGLCSSAQQAFALWSETCEPSSG